MKKIEGKGILSLLFFCICFCSCEKEGLQEKTRQRIHSIITSFICQHSPASVRNHIKEAIVCCKFAYIRISSRF